MQCASIDKLSKKGSPVQFCYSLLSIAVAPPCEDTGETDAGFINSEEKAEGGGGHHGDEDEEMECKHRFLGACTEVWLFAFGSVIGISVAGFACVLILPSLCTQCYNHFQQFLVAMAVGTLSGDAVLHLIPHSFFSHEDHGDEAEEGESVEDSEQAIVCCCFFIEVFIFLFFLGDQRCRSLIRTFHSLYCGATFCNSTCLFC